MKQNEVNTKAEQLLSVFDSPGNIEVSGDWERSLMARINASPMHPPYNGEQLKLGVLAACFFLVNLFFVIRSINTGYSKQGQRYENLQSISNELLINSTASR